MLQKVTATIETAADGSATVYAGTKVAGKIWAIKYEPGTIVTGATLTITGATSGVPILTKANAGTSDVFFYPRVIPNKNTDGAAFTDQAEMIRALKEKIKIVVASGGASKKGSITFYVEEETQAV